ncbi:MAG TPA: YbaN family protein [Acidimicrobiales bacterium]|nr:YbaN family protein [Acidimicrobiales bacterium]
MTNHQGESKKPLGRKPIRILWAFIGCISVAIGGIGIIVPGLPTTIFMIFGASCFAKSIPRFEQWILDLPAIGPMVKDYRNGLGMPRKAKKMAVSVIVVTSGISAGFLISSLVIRLVVVGLGLVGVLYLLKRVPTREDVLGQSRD